MSKSNDGIPVNESTYVKPILVDMNFKFVPNKGYTHKGLEVNDNKDIIINVVEGNQDIYFYITYKSAFRVTHPVLKLDHGYELSKAEFEGILYDILLGNIDKLGISK